MVAYARTALHEQSVEEMQRAMACIGFHGFAEEIRRGYEIGGCHGALRAYLARAKKRPEWAFTWVDIYAHVELGDNDKAFARLSRVNKDDLGGWHCVVAQDGFGVQASPTLATLRIEPMWDSSPAKPRLV